MIKSFKHKSLKSLYEEGSIKGLNNSHVKRIKSIMHIIDEADSLDDLSRPSLRLHELKGQRKGTWSVDINGPWRITFSYEDGDFYDLDYEQYH